MLPYAMRETNMSTPPITIPLRRALAGAGLLLTFTFPIVDAVADGLLLIQKKGYGSVSRIASDTGNGEVICGTECGVTVVSGGTPRTMLILHAESVGGVPFVRWGGACRKARRDPLCMVRLKNYTKVKAMFRPQFPSLRVLPTLGGKIFGPDIEIRDIDGTGEVLFTLDGIDCGTTSFGDAGNSGDTVTNGCVQEIPYGSTYALTPIPDDGYCFYKWEGPCVSGRHQPICQLRVENDMSVTGIFLQRTNTNIDPNGCL
jgi:hypothetical protein